MGIKEHVIVAIDGMSAAGKSSLASLLRETYDCNVISMDFFFLRPVQRTPERLVEPGGNIDYERFLEEVVRPLNAGEAFSYRPYDCKIGELTEPISICLNQLTVVEGVYSMHPFFDGAGSFMDGGPDGDVGFGGHGLHDGVFVDIGPDGGVGSVEHDLYDLTVFLSIDDVSQLRRLKERSPHLLERFVNEWIPMENRYFEHFCIPEKCDLLFDSKEVLD